MKKITTKIAASAAIIGAVFAAATSASAALSPMTPASNSCSYVFTQNLKQGMRGAEVMNLQKVLNMFPGTTVSAFGAGSVGSETNYFGAATRAAVSRFQVLNAAEVLAPINTTVGTGNVFSLTRAALNQICSGVVSPTPTPTTTPPTQSGAVNVNLSPNQPYTVLVAGQATARLADFTFNGNGTVTNVKLMRTGISSNDTLTNVYLFDGVMRIAGPASVTTNGDINFGSTAGLFTVSGSKTISVRSDIKIGVSGQSVGVTLTGYTVMGSTMAATSVAGPQLPVANVTLLGADFPTGNSANPSNATINAGTVNQNLWSRSLNISNRIAKLHSASFKMIGSAPVNAVANAKLFVDGTAVASGMVDSRGYISFDVSSNPVSLTTGSHVIEVRADVVAGANRSFYVSLEQSSDIRIEDSQVTGAFVTVTTNSGLTAVNLIGGTVTINNGTFTVNQDVSFANTTKLVGGASNVKMAAYKFTAFGEDTKVNTLTFNPVFTGLSPVNNNLANVGLYINGGQVGSNQIAVNGTPLIFNNLGSNLQVSAGQSVTVEIRGDVMSSTSTAYTAGTVAFNLAAGSNNAQGVGSSQLSSTASASGQLLTIASTNVTFANTTGFGPSTKAPNQLNVKIGSFSFQTGSAEGSTITNVAVDLTGSTLVTNNQITNLTVKDGSTVIGNVIGNPINGVNNFSATLAVPMSSTKVLEVYADLGSNAAGFTVTPSMQVQYRGSVSNLSTQTTNQPGVMTSAGVGTVIVAGVTFVPGSSPVAQYVLAGNPSLGIATFNVKSNNNIGSMLKDLTFTVPANTISKVTVNGKEGTVVSGVATVSDVNLAVPSDNSGINFNATVVLVCATTGQGCAGVSNTNVSLTLSTLTYNDGTQVQTISPTAISAVHTLVATKPTITYSANTSTGFGNGTLEIARVTVAADAAGDIKMQQLAINTTVAGAGAITASSVELRDANGTAVITGVAPVSGGAQNFVFSTPRTITKNTSETYSVYATFSGVSGAAGTQSVTTSLGAKANFLFTDVPGNATGLTGTPINGYPTGSQTKTN